jgi:uncharacterized membrane protein YbhN (UPF0104 family)
MAVGGVTTPVATAATILVRLATLWWAVVLGALALAYLRATQQAVKTKP